MLARISEPATGLPNAPNSWLLPHGCGMVTSTREYTRFTPNGRRSNARHGPTGKCDSKGPRDDQQNLGNPKVEVGTVGQVKNDTNFHRVGTVGQVKLGDSQPESCRNPGVGDGGACARESVNFILSPLSARRQCQSSQWVKCQFSTPPSPSPYFL
jgi:hypothetical protein